MTTTQPNPPPAEAFPVGEYLLDELEARGWSIAEFAEILGRPAQAVSEIINGHKEITRETASEIAAATRTAGRPPALERSGEATDQAQRGAAAGAAGVPRATARTHPTWLPAKGRRRGSGASAEVSLRCRLP